MSRESRRNDTSFELWRFGASRELVVLPYFVYVVLCEGGGYYTGHAKDVGKRFKQHVNGSGARYTRMYKPQRLVYVEEFATRRAAMKREKQIKRLSHDEKRKLVTSNSSVCSEIT